MRSSFRKTALATLAAIGVACAALGTSTSAEARWGGHHGWYGGGFGPGFVGGLALGAFAAGAPYYWGGGPYYGGYYAGGCYLRRRVVGYTSWGRPIVRAVRVCD